MISKELKAAMESEAEERFPGYYFSNPEKRHGYIAGAERWGEMVEHLEETLNQTEMALEKCAQGHSYYVNEAMPFEAPKVKLVREDTIEAQAARNTLIELHAAKARLRALRSGQKGGENV